MNPLAWIPNAFKEMLEVVKEAQKMAGGGWKGQVVFWTGFIVFLIASVYFLLWASKPAYDNISETMSHFNIDIRQVNISIPSSLFQNLPLALLLALLEMAILVGVGAAIGSVLGMVGNVLLSPFTTYRLDKTFTLVLPILQKVNEEHHTTETEKLLNDANKLYQRWHRSVWTRLTLRITSIGTKRKYDVKEL